MSNKGTYAHLLKGTYTYLNVQIHLSLWWYLYGAGLYHHLQYIICIVQKKYKIVPEGADEAIKGTKHEGTNMCPSNKVPLCTLKGYYHRDKDSHLLGYHVVPFFQECTKSWNSDSL